MDPIPPVLDYRYPKTRDVSFMTMLRLRLRPLGLPVAITLVLLVFFVSVAVLYYRSMHTAPATPTAVIEVRGDAACEGAQVRLEGAAGVFDKTFDAKRQFICSFHVPPGHYLLRISMSGVTLKEQNVNVGEHQYRRLTVSQTRKNAGPTTGRT